MNSRIQEYKKHFDFILSWAEEEEISMAQKLHSYIYLINKYVINKVDDVEDFNQFCLVSGYYKKGFYTRYYKQAFETIKKTIIEKFIDIKEEFI